jgi:hypothetical protein
VVLAVSRVVSGYLNLIDHDCIEVLADTMAILVEAVGELVVEKPHVILVAKIYLIMVRNRRGGN